MTSQGLCAALTSKESPRTRLTQQYLTRLLDELRKYQCLQELNVEAPLACVKFSVPFEKVLGEKAGWFLILMFYSSV